MFVLLVEVIVVLIAIILFRSGGVRRLPQANRDPEVPFSGDPYPASRSRARRSAAPLFLMVRPLSSVECRALLPAI